MSEIETRTGVGGDTERQVSTIDELLGVLVDQGYNDFVNACVTNTEVLYAEWCQMPRQEQEKINERLKAVFQEMATGDEPIQTPFANLGFILRSLQDEQKEPTREFAGDGNEEVEKVEPMVVETEDGKFED